MLSHDATSFVAPVLRRTPMFQDFTEHDLQTFASLFTPCVLEQGQHLFRQGDMGNFMALLADGALGVKLTHDGHAPYDSTIYPHEIIGEMTCIDPAPRSAAVSALARSQVMILDRASLNFLREHAPHVFTSFLRSIATRVASRLRQTNEAISTRNTPTGVFQAVVAHPTMPRELRHSGGTQSLEQSDDLRVFTERERRILVSVARKRAYNSKSFLCRDGEPGKTCFIIIEGEVEIFRERDGMKYDVGIIGPGQLLGQLALLDHSKRSATAQARGQVVAAEFSRDDFDRLISASTPLALHFQEMVTISGIRQLRQANQHYEQGH